MNRQYYNRLILEKLTEVVEAYPDLRFGQILMITNVIEYANVMGHVEIDDPFNDESESIYKRLINSLEK